MLARNKTLGSENLKSAGLLQLWKLMTTWKLVVFIVCCSYFFMILWS